ncbi:Pkinase Tyr domain containing protein [Trichuris trichiura]|uniref:Pkinase Tyr domain containing protein n=1 Tax=Trichuris trichiura TaxID=36087 RepID=A0A077Z861_TRITR|nr:Pkinase Tyr domain containing protein [Trichuris trichiura]
MILVDNGEFTVRKTGKSCRSEHYSNLCVSVKWLNKVHHVLIRLSKRVINIAVFNMSAGYSFLKHISNKSSSLKFKGNFGEVWKASMVTSANETVEVAVKLLKDDGVPEEERQQFFAECRKLRQLNHRHIVAFVGIIVDTEPVKLVMELCSGKHVLINLYSEKGNLEWKQKSRICLHVARGMEYLAKCNIIHRDLAARNCLVKNDLVKISDLGMARTGKTWELKNRKKPIPVKWTCPETQYSDVWAFGILLWEIFSDGKAPYEEMQTQYGNKERKRIFLLSGKRLEAPVETPKRLNDLMLKCMRGVVNERPLFKGIRLELESIYGELGGELSFEQPPSEEMTTCKDAAEEGKMRTMKG